MQLASPSSIFALHAEQELLAALKQQAELERHNALTLYKPHRKQDEFHRRCGQYKRRYYRAGNRSGKSTVGVAEDCAWALGYRPWYPEGDPARYAGIPTRPTKGIVTAADWDKVDEIFTSQVDDPITQGKFIKYLPREAIVGFLKNQSGKICTIVVKSIHGGESTINFETVKSFKSNEMGMESGAQDYIHVDEPIPEEMWVALCRGLVDSDGDAWFTCTPILEAWIDDMFQPDGSTRADRPEGFEYEREINGCKVLTWMITGSMHDNPHLGENAKANFIASLREEDIESRIHGRPKLYAGCIYREFDDSLHIYYDLPHGWFNFNDPPRDYCTYVATDTHPKTPHATLFAAVSPNNHVYWWAELFEHPELTEYCKRIYEVLAGRWPHRYLLEQAAYNKEATSDQTISDYFVNAGLPVERAPKDLMFGIMKVKDELMRRDARLTKNGKPIAIHHFAPHLRETLREIGRYVWNPNGSGKPVDKDDHMMENLYRMMLTGLEYVSPEDVKYAVNPMMNMLHPSTNLPMMPRMSLKDFDSRPPRQTRKEHYQSFHRSPSTNPSWQPLDAAAEFQKAISEMR